MMRCHNLPFSQPIRPRRFGHGDADIQPTIADRDIPAIETAIARLKDGQVYKIGDPSLDSAVQYPIENLGQVISIGRFAPGDAEYGKYRVSGSHFPRNRQGIFKGWDPDGMLRRDKIFVVEPGETLIFAPPPNRSHQPHARQELYIPPYQEICPYETWGLRWQERDRIAKIPPLGSIR